MAIIWGLAEVEMSGRKPVWFRELIKVLCEGDTADSQQSTIHMAKGRKRSQGRIIIEVKANVLVIKNR